MGKVDKDTEVELRRLASAPGHDRIGMIAKGCIVDLLDELTELRAMNVDVTEVPDEATEEPELAVGTPWDSKAFADWSSEEKAAAEEEEETEPEPDTMAEAVGHPEDDDDTAASDAERLKTK